MATTPEYREHVCALLEGMGTVRTRKMFGEYLLYLNGRQIFSLCDNTVFAKPWPEVEVLLPAAEYGAPYPGAKPHLILDVDDEDALRRAARLLETLALPPKAKKPKNP